MEPRMKRGIVFNNQNAILLFFAIIVGDLFLYSVAGFNPLFWLLAALSFSAIPLYLMNVRGQVFLSTIGQTAIAGLGIFLSSGFLGYESQAHFFFLILFLAYFLQPMSSTWIILGQFLYTIALLAILFFIEFDLGYPPVIPEQNMIVQQAFVVFYSAIIITILAYIYRSLYVYNLSLLTKYSKNTKELLEITNKQMSELDKSRKLLKAIYDNIDYAIFIEDLDANVILDCNQRALQLFECEENDIIGKSDLQLFKDLRSEDMSEIINELEKNEVWTGQRRLESLKGRAFGSNVKLVHFTMGLRKYRLWTISDISELMDSKEQLEDQFKALNTLNEELDSFVYSVAHDMRAPLATLQALGKIRTEDKKKQADQEKMAAQLIQRMESYIEDVVNYSKNQRAEVTVEPVDIEEVIQSIKEQLSYFENAEKIKLKTSFKDMEGFKSDRFRLDIILSNLISNSIRYADLTKPKPVIEVKGWRKNGSCFLEVSDNGLGIDPEHQEKIFDMFYRANTISSGSGLGLYIVKESVHKLGGEIECESAVGRGSTFTLRLPIDS